MGGRYRGRLRLLTAHQHKGQNTPKKFLHFAPSHPLLMRELMTNHPYIIHAKIKKDVTFVTSFCHSV
jgi:hypothetical protein